MKTEWVWVLGLGLLLGAPMAGARTAAAEAVWGLNDVSFLFPIADREAATALPNFETSGARGVLLPKPIFAKFPQLLPQDQQETFRQMRLVAVRIDPCFPADASANPACLKQIRYVWQPVVSQNGENTTLDATVHTFHLLTDDEFARLLTDLKLTKTQAGIPDARMSEPLQVNPVVKRQGLRGSYFQALKRVFLTYTGEENLKRATFMTNHMMDNVWDFGGVDVEGSAISAIVIPRVNGTLQRITNPAGLFPQATFFGGQVMPTLRVENDDISMLMSNSRLIRPVEDEEKIITQAAAALRIQDPRVHTPNTMDCVSCHAAQTAFRFANRQFPWLTLAERLQGVTYASREFSNENTSTDPDRTDNLRAFGFFRQMPAISQRVISESARVAEALNAPGSR